MHWPRATNARPVWAKLLLTTSTSGEYVKESVSCESIELLEGQPRIERRPMSMRPPLTSSGSSAAPTTINFPLRLRPPRTTLIALPLVTVARMTLAPPHLISSAADRERLSTYQHAPSFRAKDSLSISRATAMVLKPSIAALALAGQRPLNAPIWNKPHERNQCINRSGNPLLQKR